jgi:hypothetical protein
MTIGADALAVVVSAAWLAKQENADNTIAKVEGKMRFGFINSEGQELESV